VLHDVLEGWRRRNARAEVYGVVLRGRIEDDSLAVDLEATRELRAA